MLQLPVMKKADPDKRKDTALRSAIDRLRQNIISVDICTIYQRTLRELLTLTQSAYAFAVEPTRINTKDSCDKAHSFTLMAYANTQSLELASDNTFITPHELDDSFSFLNNSVRTQEPVVFKKDDIPLNLGQALNWPEPTQLLIIPLTYRDEVVCLIGLANAQKTYHSTMVRRYWPLLITTACAVRLSENKSNKFLSPEGAWCQTLSRLIQVSSRPMLCVDHYHNITLVNSAAEKLFEYMQRDLIGLPISELVPERFPCEHQVQTFCVNCPHTGHCTLRVSQGKKQSGALFPIALTAIPFRENNQNAFLVEVTDKSDLKSKFADHMQQFKAISDFAPIGIMRTNAQWEATFVNQQWCSICGFDQTEDLKTDWINAIHPSCAPSFLETLRAHMVNGQQFRTEVQFLTTQGETLWVDFQAKPLFESSGYVSGFISTILDMTYRHQTEEKLRYMAENDALMGLANRALFQDRLHQALKRTERHGPFALLCLDLDGFKNVNDTLGHDAGDLLLVEAARRLLDCVREEDTVARVGGDEFMILIEGLQDSSVAADIADKILKTLQNPIMLGEQEVFISTSIGITFAVGSRKTDPNTLIKQADIALYRAKAEGRNNFQYFSPELEEASKHRLILGNSLHRALERIEFRVFYQLQSDIQTGEVVGAEALIRWHHPDKGLLSPQEFIPLLEETGLINPVSVWVWRQAFKDLRAWMNKGLMGGHSHMSVNLSPAQLRDPLLKQNLEAAMHDSGLDGKHIVLEITESALLKDNFKTVETLKSIQTLGIRIALDDFGTGYSSLTYLKRFSINLIKIDQTFIRDILTDPDDAAITQAVLALAKSLNIQVVAEGVDAPEKLTLLKNWGCDVYQGYFLNKPEPCEQVEQRLDRQNPLLLA